MVIIIDMIIFIVMLYLESGVEISSLHEFTGHSTEYYYKRRTSGRSSALCLVYNRW